MKKAYLKDSIKMFQKNLFRFISIVLILILGNAFFIGMNAVSPAMESTAENYMKENKIYDILMTSNLGFQKEDIKKWKVNDVSEVYGIHTLDTLAKFDDKDIVVRVISQDENSAININDIYEGRNIENETECIICSALEEMYNYKIGDSISLRREDDIKVEDYLNRQEFKIVGKVKTPIFLSKFYGNTDLLTGNLNAYMIVKEKAFKSQNYTAVFLKTNIDDSINKFSEEYKNKVKELLPQLEEINKQIAQEKFNKIYQESNQKIEENEGKIKKAEDDLKTAYTQIKQKQLELNSQICLFSKNIAMIYDMNVLHQRTQEKENKIIEVHSKLDRLNEEEETYNTKCESLTTETEKQKAKLEELERNIDKNLSEVYALKNNENRYVELNKSINALYFEYYKSKEEYKKLNDEYQETSKKYQEIKKEVEVLNEEKNNLQQDMYASFTVLKDFATESNNKELINNAEKIKTAIESLEQNTKTLQEKNVEDALVNAKKIVLDQKNTLNQFKVDAEAIPLYKDGGFQSLKDDLEKIKIMGRIFPVMFFIVAALVTITTVTRMIEEDRKNIGILKALGYGKKKIMSRYIIYTLCAAILGALLGILIGNSIIVQILFESYCSLYDLPNLVPSIPWMFVAISLIISLFATVCITIFIIIKSLSENASDLMRPKMGKEGKNILLEKIPFIWKRLSFLYKISLRNIFRFKRRLLMTLIGIAGCTALIYAGLGLQSSINDIGKKQFKEVKKMDMEIYLQKEMDENTIQEVETIIQQEDKITDFTPVKQQTLTIEANDNKKDIFYVVIQGNDADKYIRLQERISGEKIKLSDDGVIITEKLAEILKVKKEDKVYLIENGEQITVKVLGITENYLYNYVYLTPKVYERLTGKAVGYNGFFANLKEEVSIEEASEIGNKLKENDSVASIQLEANYNEEFLTSLNSLMTIVILFIGCASLLSFTVLINLNNINIEERTRELATIKLLGFYKKEIESYVFRENIILTLLGIVFGLILGMGILGIIIQSAEVETIFLAKEINLMHLGVAALLTLFFTFITNFFMKKKLKRINMSDSLKSIE